MSQPTGQASEEDKATVLAALQQKLAEVELEKLEEVVATQDLSAVTTTAVTLAVTQPQSGSGEPSGRDCFYPDKDAEVRAFLSELGADGLQAMTVPDSIEMQRGNSALAITLPAHVNLYKNTLRAEAEKIGGINADAVRDRVRAGIILIKQSASGLAREGILIHEAGHIVLGQKNETGEVFAFEITTIAKRYGVDAAAQWVTNRPISYYAQKVNGLVDALDAAMSMLGEEVHALWLRERGKVESNRNAPPSAKSASGPRFAVVAVGEAISGTLEDLRRRLGPDAVGNTIRATAQPGDTVKFADISWKLEDVNQAEGGTTYTLRRLLET